MDAPFARQVAAKVLQWHSESALYFCRLAKCQGAEFVVVEYPTGLRMMRVSCGSESAEVPPGVADTLARSGFRVEA